MKKYLQLVFLFLSINVSTEEMIIGSETIDPGIKIVFEAAPKDIVFPEKFYLPESETDIHIEMLANWSEDNLVSVPPGGFVAYLKVKAIVANEKGAIIETDLTPHLNLVDNLHYAQNIKLPGSIKDLYDVTFIIEPPDRKSFGIHFDWHEKFGGLIQESSFTYKNLNFEQIALKQRR
jgi:uncharacterized protein involved in high-affinity Fe2+ transport